MALHDFGYMAESFYHLFIHAAALQVQSYVGAGTVAEAFGVDIESTACDDVLFYQSLHALVDGSPRHAALRSHILERYACILRQDVQYLSV